MTPTDSARTGHQHCPPAGVGWMLPFYDSMSAVLGIPRVHQRLLMHAHIGAGDQVLDIGCGTGTMTVAAKQSHPLATVTGLDPDAAALARAREKAWVAGCDVQFDEGYAGALPYATASVDRVLSAFMLHHLDADERERTLGEVRRVLTPSGSLHLVDFGRGEGATDVVTAAGFTRGALTTGHARFGVAVTIVDASP